VETYGDKTQDQRAPLEADRFGLGLTGLMVCSPEGAPVAVDDHNCPPVPGRVVSVYIPSPLDAA
jgi:hypothetical protein